MEVVGFSGMYEVKLCKKCGLISDCSNKKRYSNAIVAVVVVAVLVLLLVLVVVVTVELAVVIVLK
jgi:uncharacterized protein (DUF983 family)